jgi:Tol biopolymer transport system component
LISGAVGPGDHEHETSSIWLVSILGGAPRRLRGDAYRASVSPDDSLVAYMSQDGIWLADADGENPREFIEARDWGRVGSPAWSSDGRRVVYIRVGWAESGPVKTIESRGLDEEASIVLVRNVSSGAGIWAQDFLMLDDRLVYAMGEPAPRKRDRNLWEIAIGSGKGKPRGEPRRLTDWVGFNIRGLSVTADRSQLAFKNHRGQNDVFVGELGDGGRSLENARRLTLDDRNDLPSCWTPDGRAVVFQSDRYGNEDLLVQGLDQRNAQDLVLGAEDQRDPHLTPDGTSFLYWELQEGASGPKAPRRLLRIPVTGGPTEFVLEAQGGAGFDCATTPDGPCLLFEPRYRERIATISRLDPITGKGEELWRIDRDPTVDPTIDRRPAISPDGSRFAMVGHTKDDRSIRLLDALTGELIRDIDVDGLPGMDFYYVEWSPDGSGFYVVGDSPRGAALLRVDLQGEAHVLYEDQTGDFFSVKPSPDGRHLAFGKRTKESNAWMIEKF